MPDTDPTTRLTVTAPGGAVHDLATAEAQDAIDGHGTAATTEPLWADDGHRVRVTLGRYGFETKVICPFTLDQLAGLPWESLPVCRRAGDQDGNPRPDKSPCPDCGLALMADEWGTDEFFDVEAVAGFEVAVLPVVYRFAGYDGDEVYVRPRPAPVVIPEPAEEIRRLREQRDHLVSAFDKLSDQMGELVQAARGERDRLTAQAGRLRAELDGAAGYLAATHRHANRHDVLGANLGCAGCELLGRIEGAPQEPDRVPLRTPTPGRTDMHFSPGYEGEIPDHHGVFGDCPMPGCVTSRRQQDAADQMQDLADGTRGGAR